MGINGSDRIHRTLGVNIPQDEVVVGIPGYTLREDNSFWNALLMPFRKQLDYWLRLTAPSGAAKFARGAKSRPARRVICGACLCGRNPFRPSYV